MFAIAFDMVVSDLKKNYGEPYNNAYFEIGIILRKYGFYNTQGSVYLTERNDMANLYRAIEALKKTDWFRDSVRDIRAFKVDSVRDIRAFKVEDWSDFTPVFKE